MVSDFLLSSHRTAIAQRMDAHGSVEGNVQILVYDVDDGAQNIRFIEIDPTSRFP